MRMGTLPIVAPTGGLKDTVEDRCVDLESGGFRKLGVPYFRVLKIRVLLFRVPY